MAEQEEIVPEVIPQWVLVQKNSFTKLVNTHVKVPEDKIQDLAVDFKNGKKLLNILKVVLNTPVPSPERGSSRLHFVNNVNKAIAVMKKLGVKIVDIGAEEIVDGNLKMTLGMTWAVIMHGFIENIQEGGASAKDGLLLWCQRKTKDHKNVKITDFSKSWKSGLGFCALIHAHRPDLIDYDSLNPKNAEENLETAFSVAQENFDIARILEVNDIVGTDYPDDKSIMAYVSTFYHYFSKFNDVENSAKKLQKILDMNQENAKLIDDYEKQSSDLLEWMKSKLPFLKDRCGESPEYEDIKKKYAELNEFRSREKPPRADEKTKLESDYQAIQTRLNIQNRPQYLPPDQLNPKFLDDYWRQLEKEEQELLNWLEEMLNLLQKTERLTNRFYYKCNKQEEWMRGIAGDVDINKMNVDMGLSELYGLSKKFKSTQSEIKSRENRIVDISSLKDQLEQLKYKKIHEVQARYDDIMQQWNTLQDNSKKYPELLGELTKRAKQLDDWRVEYSACASGIKCWLDDAMEDYGDDYKPSELKEIEEWKGNHQSFTQNISLEVNKINQLKQLDNQIQELTSVSNPYCSISVPQVDSRMSQLEQLCRKRSQMLNDEHERVTASNALKADFDKLVAEMESWKKEFMQKVSKSLMDKSATLESKKAILTTFHDEIETYSSQKIPVVDSMIEKIKDLAAANWERPANTATTIKSGYKTAIRSICSMLSELDNQIVVRDSSGLSDKELEDINVAFGTFAKEDKNSLTHKEFLNCLISLGFNLKLESEKNEEFAKAIAVVDPLGTGKIPQSALIAYVTAQRKSADSAAEIADSFKTMAKGKDFILPEEIRSALAPKHAEDVIKNMMPSNAPGAPTGALDYRSYAENIYGESDV